MNILILENDKCVLDRIKTALTTQQFNINYTDTIQDALMFLFEHECVLIFIDINYCSGDNVDFLLSIRRKIMTPVIILSDEDTFFIKQQAIQNGADDVLIKPFDVEECNLKAVSLIRRYTEFNPNAHDRRHIITYENICINTDFRKVFVDHNEVYLTRKEYAILSMLISTPNRVYTYEQIYEQVWLDHYIGDKRKIIDRIHSLRKKLGEDNPIQSVHDTGYKV